MSSKRDDRMSENGVTAPNRRRFLGAGLGVAAAAFVPHAAAAQGQGPAPAASRDGRRRLGRLEVSAVGLGVQNMSRKYETTVPYRPEMIAIIRAAYDRGVTFFDAPEAYGPWEVERIRNDADGAHGREQRCRRGSLHAR